jgi:N-acetylmuramoyl-L-alanine amidase
MKKILISAGHSNTDPGAVAGERREATIAVEMRNLIAGYLQKQGAAVMTDGADNDNLPLSEAIKLAKKCDLAIEIHCNASENTTASGVECISLPDKKELAQKISASIRSITGSKLRGDSGWIDQSKSQHSRLGFVADGRGIIVELFFLSNPFELAKYDSSKLLLARTIADTIYSEAI